IAEAKVRPYAPRRARPLAWLGGPGLGARPQGGWPRELVAELDHEGDPRFEPVTVELLDLRPSRDPAQVKAAFGVIRQGDRLADRDPGRRQLFRLLQLSSHSPEGPPTDPELHVGVRPDV